MLASTKRRIFASRSATSQQPSVLQRNCRCEASSFSTAIRPGVNTCDARLVFEIQYADQLGLFQQRQAKKRPCLFAAMYSSSQTRSPRGRHPESPALSADDLLKDQHGQFPMASTAFREDGP